MAEESAKIKQVIINNRHTNYIINFKIDIASMTILEVNYNIAAVNGEFSSPSIKIDMGKENLLGYLIYQLKEMINSVTEIINGTMDVLDFDTVYIPSNGLISGASVIIFSANDKKDDMNRGIINLMYVSTTEDASSVGELYTIPIPVDIMPAFIETFTTILIDKDIITVEESTEDSDKDTKSEDQEDTNKEE